MAGGRHNGGADRSTWSFLLIGTLARFVYDDINPDSRLREASLPTTIAFFILEGIACSMLVLVGLGLLVECFINVVHLTGSTLRIPVWSMYIPRLS